MTFSHERPIDDNDNTIQRPHSFLQEIGSSGVPNKIYFTYTLYIYTMAYLRNPGCTIQSEVCRQPE